MNRSTSSQMTKPPSSRFNMPTSNQGQYIQENITSCLQTFIDAINIHRMAACSGVLGTEAADVAAKEGTGWKTRETVGRTGIHFSYTDPYLNLQNQRESTSQIPAFYQGKASSRLQDHLPANQRNTFKNVHQHGSAGDLCSYSRPEGGENTTR